MQTQPQVSFDNLPVDGQVRDAALDHVAALERLWNRITGCHVVIAQPHRHHRRGRLSSVRRLQGGEKIHAERPHGRISQIFPLEGYGFIKTPDGRDVYFHRNALSDLDFRVANVGTPVSFTEEDGDDGPQAIAVHVTRSHARPGHAR